MVKTFYVLLAAFLLPNLNLFSQTPWELKKDKDNIRIYSRSVKDCRFNELKAVFDLPGNFMQLKSVLEDVGNYKYWVYSTAASNLIERRSDSEMVYYSQVSAPWPLSNRDFFSDTRITFDSCNRHMRISSRNIDNQSPSKDHVVRIPYMRAEWYISIISPTVMHVEYTLAWNPGGSIPGWVANMFATTGPFQSFSQLKKLLAGMPAPATAIK
jgi:START domain-containing protein